MVSTTLGNEIRQEITNSSGNFSFEGVGLGDWSVFAEKSMVYWGGVHGEFVLLIIGCETLF